MLQKMNLGGLKTYFGLFCFVLGIYLFLSPAHFISTPDEELNIRTTLSLIEGRRGAIPPLPMGFASKTGIDGNEYAQYGLGVPVAAAPWTMLGLMLDPTGEVVFTRDEGLIDLNALENVTQLNNAGTDFLRFWVTVLTMIISTLTVLFLYFILIKLGSKQSNALFFSLLYAIGTYALPHGRTFFTEPMVAFCWMGALAMLIVARQKNYCGRWFLYAGVFWAYALLTRFDTLVTLPAAAWFLLIRTNDEKQFRLSFDIKQIVAFAAPFVVVVGIILLYNQYRFDSFFSTGYEDQAESIKFVTPLLVGLYGFLFTPGRSLFFYSPPLIFFVWGAYLLWKHDRWLSVGVFIHSAIFMAIMCKWQNWAGGYDWGPRHIFQLTPIFMIFAAYPFRTAELFDSTTKKVGWGILFLFSAFVQILALSADPTQTIKDFLGKWPSQQVSTGLPIETVLLQFNVHLPQFSSPVLHWQKIMQQGPNLLLLRWSFPNEVMVAILLISLGLIVVGGLLLWWGRDDSEPGSP